MVIISTSATEVSIQAVSPEFGVQLTCILASQAGGGASAGGAAAGSLVAAGAAGAWANDTSTVTALTKAARRSPQTSASSPAREDLLNVMMLLLSWMLGAGSKRRSVGFAGTDAYGLVDAEHEDLSVADLAGLGCGRDGLDHFVDLVGRHGHLDLQLGQKAHGIFGAAIDFGMALLAAISLDLGHGHPVHADAGECVAHLVELEWLDDRHDDLHASFPAFPVTRNADRISSPPRWRENGGPRARAGMA